MRRLTIGCSRKEDKSSFTFTHILGVDSSRMPLGFIFPLLCLKLYWGGVEFICDLFFVSS